MPLAPGQTILNKYRILELIGEGGFARVWLAEEPRFDHRKVAIKELLRDKLTPGEMEEQERRFVQEIEIARLLEEHHVPNVVRALTVEHLEDDTPLLVMEYMPGGSLADLIDQHPQGLPIEQAVKITLDLCQALKTFHNLPAMPVHRDIKPSNVLFDTQGRAYLADFGLAQLPGRSGRTQMQAEPHPGTPLYMAPEQARSPEPLTPAADLYALGCVLFEMLTGKPYKRVKPGTKPGQMRSEVPVWLDGVVVRALEEDPWTRWQSATEMAEALGTQQVPPSVPPQKQPPPQPGLRKRTSLLAIGLATVAVLLTMIVLVPRLLGRGGEPPIVAPAKTTTPILGPIPAATITAKTEKALGSTGPLVPVATSTSTATSVPSRTPTATRRPTNTPMPTSTPVPTATPTPRPSLTRTFTPTRRPTATPTFTPAPTSTQVPTRTSAPKVPTKTVHAVGQPWEEAGVSLVLTNLEVRSESDGGDAAARAWFHLFNKSGQKLLVEVDWSKIRLEDSLGNEYVDWEGGGTTSHWVEPGRSYNFDRYYTRRAGERSRVPSNASFLDVVVDRFSRINDAQWRFEINPTLTPMPAPPSSKVKKATQTWEQGGLALTLDKIELRALSDGGDAAAQAWFKLTNQSNERMLVELDYSHIYLLDSFGRRFSDWDGGGLESRWLDPGQSWEFNRYYTEMAGWWSRVTRGADFVLVVAEDVSRLTRAQWKVSIPSALSSTSSPNPGTMLMVGEPWEEAEVTLNLTNLEIRAESDGGDAAAHAWFRFFNKSGQKLLVEIDWSKIHLEDNLGNRYVDWDGGGTTSVWVEPGRSYNFDRYYTRRAGERSRMPSNASFVDVVVDEFSRISDARWRFEINPTLEPMGAPAPSQVKAVGETWEQDDLALTLDKIEIRAESDSGDAAGRAWFNLVNRSSERLLVESDFSRIYLIDSFGRRFSDWDGGGLESRWLDPGQSWEFNRYYTEMAGWWSRVTRNAEFVLVKVEKLGPIENAQWQFDIVR